jgi:glutathione peroxidase
VHFPIFEKVEVNGPKTNPLYQFLRNNTPELYDANSQATGVVPWNFAKFVLNRDGKVVKFAHPSVKPQELLPIV